MKETVLKVLKSFGLDKELNLYLKLFQKTPSHKFAVIKISGNTLDKKIEVVAEDLAFLSKLGLTPIVIHGAGKQIDLEMKKKKIPIKKIGGLRVTDKQTMSVIEKIMNKMTTKLVKSLNAHGASAVNANDLGIIEAKKHTKQNGIDLGLVGDIKMVHIDKISDICESDCIPVIGSVAYDGDTVYNINADTLANEIVKKLKPKKFILITETGGVLDKNGNILSTIDVQLDLPDLIKNKIITEGMLLKVKEISDLLEKAPGTVVEITSAENLLQELFTVKGSGTFIRYGANFTINKKFKVLNKKKIKKLIEESFCKKLVRDYFGDPAESIIVDKDYTGLAIIKKLNGTAYLDKFAVSKAAQGNGLGKAIWHLVKKLYPSLIWRSSINNQINNWYFKNCDGAHKTDEWIVFWYNLDYPTVLELMPVVSNLPATLVKS